jgi:hypothetical protein
MSPSKAGPLARVPRARIGARRKQITNVPYMFFFGSRKIRRLPFMQEDWNDEVETPP